MCGNENRDEIVFNKTFTMQYIFMSKLQYEVIRARFFMICIANAYTNQRLTETLRIYPPSWLRSHSTNYTTAHLKKHFETTAPE